MSNSSIWPTDRILSSATTPCQSEPWSNNNEEVFHSPPKILDYSLAIRLFTVISMTLLVGDVLSPRRDAVRVFYSSSRLDTRPWFELYPPVVMIVAVVKSINILDTWPAPELCHNLRNGCVEDWQLPLQQASSFHATDIN